MCTHHKDNPQNTSIEVFNPGWLQGNGLCRKSQGNTPPKLLKIGEGETHISTGSERQGLHTNGHALALCVVGWDTKPLLFGAASFVGTVLLDALKEILTERMWIAWSDYLIFASVLLAFFALVTTLVPREQGLALGACIAAIFSEVGFIPSILAHYRIVLGASRQGFRSSGEPWERVFVVLSFILAAGAMVAVIATQR